LTISIAPGITPEHLAQVYAHPQMSRTSHDFRAAAPVVSSAALYLSAFVRDEFAGTTLLVKTCAHEIEVHSLLFPEFVRWSREIWKRVIRWAFEDPAIQRLTAQIPEDLLTVRNLAKRCGFSDEGFKRRAICRGGKWMGMYILGMTPRR
jgi:hypothetical protein